MIIKPESNYIILYEDLTEGITTVEVMEFNDFDGAEQAYGDLKRADEVGNISLLGVTIMHQSFFQPLKK